jgi:acyl dehydratase
MQKFKFETPKALYFEDFEEGAQLNEVEKGPMMVGHQVRWAGASDNYHHEFHHDEYVAKAQGLPGILLSGPLMASLLLTEVTRWFGVHAKISRFFDRNSANTMPRDAAIIRGFVKRKYEEGGKAMVEIECWIENQNGVKTTPGGATAELPRRPAVQA